MKSIKEQDVHMVFVAGKVFEMLTIIGFIMHSVHSQDNYALGSQQQYTDFKYAVHVQLMFVQL